MVYKSITLFTEQQTHFCCASLGLAIGAIYLTSIKRRKKSIRGLTQINSVMLWIKSAAVTLRKSKFVDFTVKKIEKTSEADGDGEFFLRFLLVDNSTDTT